MLDAKKTQYSSTKSVPISESPKGDLHNDLLRRSLEQRDRQLEQHKRELAEKDKVIERLRREMETMKSSLTVSGTLPVELPVNDCTQNEID
jgi:predicted RNase H-like nuclease (RuvC/YqgF family)